MDRLTAVNLILPKLGEHVVTSLAQRHSTVALILDEVDSQVRTLCQRGWWFNEYSTTLQRNTAQEIELPLNALSFLPDDMSFNAVQRAGKLFNADTLNFTWAAPMAGTLKVLLDFEELPESAAQAAWYSALCAVYVTDIGMAQDLQMWDQARISAATTMEAEHLDQKKYSTARTYRYQRIRSAMRG